MNRFLLVGIISLASFGQTVAQVDLEGTLRAGPEDAAKYLEGYMEPAILSFANGLANGWVNTAKNHKILGVDLTFSINMASVPDEALTFAYGNASAWSNLVLVSGDGNLPTLVGGNSNNRLSLRSNAEISDGQGNSIVYTAESSPFDAAPGIDVSNIPFAAIPTPTAQLGIGLMKNTDLKIRYMPSINTDDFEFSLFGVGVMHDIKQWIPGLKLVPIDLAGFVGTTSMKVKIATEIPDNGGNDKIVSDDGTTEFKVSSTTIQVLASKKLSVFTPYVSLGYNIVSSNLDVLGTYTYTNNTGASIDLKDPVSLEFGGGSSPRATIGGQLKLLVLTLHADYTFQKYNTFTAGIGISVR